MTGPGDRLEREFDAAPGAVGTVALAWLPAGDYEQAVALWPDFAGSDRVAGPDGPLPHAQYCRAMQEQLVQYAAAGAPGMVIAPVRVAPFTPWCAERGDEPDSADARAEFAAHLGCNGRPGFDRLAAGPHPAVLVRVGTQAQE